MQKIIFEVKICKNIRSSTWLCVTSNMKNSSRKTWQTSHLFFKPLQIQTYDKKVGGRWHIMSPRLKKWRGHVPRVPHQIAPISSYDLSLSDHAERFGGWPRFCYCASIATYLLFAHFCCIANRLICCSLCDVTEEAGQRWNTRTTYKEIEVLMIW